MEENGEVKKNAFSNALTFCQTKTLWTMAHPQNTIPRPMKTDVTIAGVEWNWMNVYRIMPIDHNDCEINIAKLITMYNKRMSICTFSEFAFLVDIYADLSRRGFV